MSPLDLWCGHEDPARFRHSNGGNGAIFDWGTGAMLSWVVGYIRALFGAGSRVGAGAPPTGAPPPGDGTSPFPYGNVGVGGIESITIDGKRWFFGYTYSGDMVLTPFFGDPDAMAVFASRHMLQTDGAHDAEYWRERVEEGIESNLTSNDADRTFATADFRRIAAALAAAEAENRPVPSLAAPNHLIHLVATARADETPWETTAEEDTALARLGLPEGETTKSSLSM